MIVTYSEPTSLSDLYERLPKYGGILTTTDALDYQEIALARVENRMWVNDDGIGFVHIPKAQIEHGFLTARERSLLDEIAGDHVYGSGHFSLYDGGSSIDCDPAALKDVLRTLCHKFRVLLDTLEKYPERDHD